MTAEQVAETWMGPPQYMALVDAGIAGVEPGFDSESLPPPFMASVARSEADLPSSIAASEAQPDLNISPEMSRLVDANVQILRVESLVSSLRKQVAALGLRG